jgi:Family of unknown function (DUF5338)
MQLRGRHQMGTPGKRGPKPSAAPAFLARKDAIAATLDRGHKMRAAYETYGAQLGISYSQFTRYVNQHIRKKEPREKAYATAAEAARSNAPALASPAGADRTQQLHGGPIATGNVEPKRFIHDPTAIHTKKLF